MKVTDHTRHSLRHARAIRTLKENGFKELYGDATLRQIYVLLGSGCGPEFHEAPSRVEFAAYNGSLWARALPTSPATTIEEGR